MNEYYIIWSVYDDEREESTVLSRALLSALTPAEAKVKAEALCSTVAADWSGAPVSASQIEVYVSDLDDYLATGRHRYQELLALKREHEEDQEDQEDNQP
jgi:hypothetical protein